MNNSTLSDYIDRYTHGQLNAEEYRELVQLLEDPSQQHALEQLMDESWVHWIGSDLHFPQVANRVKQVIFTKADEKENLIIEPTRRLHFFRRGWLKYAAAIILMVGTLTYFWTTTRNTGQTSANGHNRLPVVILPGRERAVLTLADGSMITLDSAGNGQLANQGGVKVIKQQNGKLSYDHRSLISRELMWNTMSTPRGGQYQVTLPDGTNVWLNAASSITFPTAFIGNTREVKISGEVYMDVAKDKAKPFIVDISGRASVQVLGTSFNITAYSDDQEIRTTLIDGSVKMNGQVTLKPRQQFVQSFSSAVTTGNYTEVSGANIEQVLAWKNGYFSFENMGLRQMARQIERWYDIDIEFLGAFDDLSLRGEMDRGVQLADILRFFNSYGFSTKLEGRILTLQKTERAE